MPDAWLLDAAHAASARGSQNAEVSLSGRLPLLFTGAVYRLLAVAVSRPGALHGLQHATGVCTMWPDADLMLQRTDQK